MQKLILIFAITMVLGCSKKEDVQPTNPVSQLPAATQTGANTVGCLVNGELFLPRGSNPFGSPLITCAYQFVNGGYEFGLSFSNNQQSQLRGVSIGTHKLQFIEGQTYNLTTEQQNNSAFAYFDISGGLVEGYSTNQQIVGELKITKLDQSNAIISGTFWYDAIKASNNEIIRIREGRFDMQYSQ